MSAHETTPLEPSAAPVLELIWQPDAIGYALTRTPDGSLSGAHLQIGMPAVDALPHLGHGVVSRRLEVRDIVALAAAPPADVALGGTTRAVFAIVELAHRSVVEGLVHPHLEYGAGSWLAFWGATLDDSVQADLAAIAAALPAVSADAFGGDREEAVHDLYARIVDQRARDVLRDAGVRFDTGPLRRRATPLSLFLDGLTARDPELPRHSGFGALERKLTNWVDRGLEHRSTAPWLLGLRLDEQRTTPTSDGATDEPNLVLELWLQAADDPSLGLPASLLWSGGGDVFAFLRAGDPQGALRRQLAELEPLLAEGGIRLDADEPGEVELGPEAVRFFLRTVMPKLEAQGVPVLLPTDWVASASRLRLNLTAKSTGTRRAGATGLLSTAALASFDWQLAIGDVPLTEEEIAELATAKEPLIRVGGRWHVLRRSEVERALRFLERRRTGVGLVELVRAVSGIDTDEAGLELGEVTLDPALSDLLEADDKRQFQPLRTPNGMRFALFPFQERGHGWIRMLGDLGVGGILADDMGLGKTVQAIAMIVSEREQFGSDAIGPTLVVCPMSVTRQWVREIARFAPGLRVHLHHGNGRLAGTELIEAVTATDVVVTSYDIATRDIDTLAAVDWDRVLFDEAQDVKNPATKRARAMRRLPARRRLAMTGTPIENHLGELWALMDLVNPGLLGSRERFDRSFARPIELYSDERATERLRATVQPFILRRAKDAPEVELELPSITVSKSYCRLTLEQAALYQATMDRWLPRIAEHERAFDRRGAVLAMLGQLKQVCNHPEMVLPTGRPLDGRSGKLERLVGLLQDVPAGDKSLVFTQYPGFDRLVPHLEQRLGRAVGFFHGALSARTRDDLVASFSADADPAVLVISIRAGGRGLNLPVANHVFHFDRWWNPAVEQQATDRVYRFGQRKDVFVHSLISTATLEERIDELLEAKRELAEKVIAGHSENWLADFDLDAIRAAVELAPDAAEAA